ncbi:MAG: hypothetical protein IAE82_08165 [Opitutaceae bacterium]|nr:hypothetical protein [Opitutaceae bacterium]
MSSHRTTARLARRSRAFAPWRVLAGLLTALGVLAIGLAARSPETHEHVHGDAAHPEHVCAITLAATGFCDTAASAPEIAPGTRAPSLLAFSPKTFVWSAPDYWLTPALAPPVRAS